MAEQILQAFREKKEFNIPELALRLQADIRLVKEVVDYLVHLGKLKVKKKHPPRAGNIPASAFLRCRCSIRGSSGDTYVRTGRPCSGRRNASVFLTGRPAIQ